MVIWAVWKESILHHHPPAVHSGCLNGITQGQKSVENWFGGAHENALGISMQLDGNGLIARPRHL
eukprot:363192-Chlamydomonas_euryale.AAC.14